MQLTIHTPTGPYIITVWRRFQSCQFLYELQLIKKKIKITEKNQPKNPNEVVQIILSKTKGKTGFLKIFLSVLFHEI